MRSSAAELRWFIACVGRQSIGYALAKLLYLYGFTDQLTLLGRFAVKKIAVGESHSYLLGTLREVREVILYQLC